MKPMLLPTPADHGLPHDATIAVPVPAEGLTLHRLVEGEAPRLKDFEPALTRAQAERQDVPELFRGSISHWLEQAQAAEQSRSRSFYVARVRLAPDGLVRAALTEQFGPGHVDVWAHPQRLLDAVAEVVRDRRRA
jgi:hypothetical protein